MTITGNEKNGANLTDSAKTNDGQTRLIWTPPKIRRIEARTTAFTMGGAGDATTIAAPS